QVQTLGNRVRVGIQIARGIAQQQGRKRRIVVDDDPPFAVQDLPARRKDRHVAHAVLLRQQRVFAALHHLQPPQAVGEKQEYKQNHILHHGKAKGGNFFFAAEHQSSVSARPISTETRPTGKQSPRRTRILPLRDASQGKAAERLTSL